MDFKIESDSKGCAALNDGIKIDTFSTIFFVSFLFSFLISLRDNARERSTPKCHHRVAAPITGQTRETNDFIHDCSSRRADVPFVSLRDRWNARLLANRPRNPVLQRAVISFAARTRRSRHARPVCRLNVNDRLVCAPSRDHSSIACWEHSHRSVSKLFSPPCILRTVWTDVWPKATIST